ncbi:hypothetical protein D3C76_1467330 [compost metagenome]
MFNGSIIFISVGFSVSTAAVLFPSLVPFAGAAVDPLLLPPEQADSAILNVSSAVSNMEKDFFFIPS